MLSRVATWGSLLRQAAEAGLKLLTRSTQQRERTAPSRSRAGTSRSGTSRTGTSRTEASPRPSTGGARTAPARDRARRVAYAPDLDGAADPGEVVWTWVPYEEDDGRGKDRPVLVVGREGRDLVGLMLSSQADRADDRNWVGVGAGKWDAQGRPSYVRLDRVIEVGEHEIRREGAVLDKRRFDRVAQELRERYGWT
jgi:PemK-like, MazF-like toxin of type II toxin-antitoxin system